MDVTFFQSNRMSIGRVLRGGVVVLSAYTKMQRNNDGAYSFEQESNFWYLTGISHPDWWVIIDSSRDKTFLVSPDISETHRVFDGSLSREDAKRISGADEVVSRDEAMVLLRNLANKHSVVYALGEQSHADYFDFHFNPSVKLTWQMLERVFNKVQDCRPELAKLRAIKQQPEIVAMKKAINTTVGAFGEIYAKLDRYKFEYQVEADFTQYFRSRGARGHAYDPIVASGKHACTLHYCENNDRLKKGNLLLMDVGARMNGYAADVTRTYAIGEPTKRQRNVHAAVEVAHTSIIALLKPGLLVEDYHRQVDIIMKNALMSVDLLKSVDDSDAYRRYFPHAISHGLGVDVHDALGKPTVFLPGMVLTVEPGIYILEEGLGVRIEDDILITESGHSNLSGVLSTSL